MITIDTSLTLLLLGLLDLLGLFLGLLGHLLLLLLGRFGIIAQADRRLATGRSQDAAGGTALVGLPEVVLVVVAGVAHGGAVRWFGAMTCFHDDENETRKRMLCQFSKNFFAGETVFTASWRCCCARGTTKARKSARIGQVDGPDNPTSHFRLT